MSDTNEASPRRKQGRGVFWLAVLVSFFGHIGAVQGLSNAARNAPAPKRRTVEFEVVRPPPPAPPAPPPLEEQKKKPPKKIDLDTPKDKVPPPSNTTEVSETPPEKAKPVFGMTNKSFTNKGSGGFKVRYGNTTMKSMEEDYTPPDQVKRYKSVAAFKVEKAPRRIGSCKGEYPKEAAELGIEGSIKLRVEVLTDGKVGEVQVLRGLGFGLDQAAVSALKRCRFTPAQIGDEKVVTTIPYTYTWVLEE